jgi:Cft2 family RNA processing exonuclease
MNIATTARFHAISGLGSKGPACFLLETGSRRILIDLGYGPDPGKLPGVDAIGAVDALVLSHGHKDHAGALQLLAKVGNPPIFATDIVAARLEAEQPIRPLPLRGSADVLGVPIVTGRNGHAPGGIWIRFGPGEGLIYMGDCSTESQLYAFDAPPPAAAIVIDASNGDNDTSLAQQAVELAAVFDGNCVLLPVPADGRGPEIALHVAGRGRAALRLDGAMAASLRRLIDNERDSLREGITAALKRTIGAAGAINGPHGVMLATPANAASGETERLIAQWEKARDPAIVFTGYVPPGTPADRLVKSQRARFMRWNVHPRLSDNVALVRSVGARMAMAAFCDRKYLAALSQALAPARVTMDTPITL